MDVSKFASRTPLWVDLMTPDLKVATKFYAGLFGWTFVEGPPESGGYNMAFLRGRKVAGMGQLPPGAPMPSAWTMYLNVDDADVAIAEIRELGGNVLMGPMDVMSEGRMVVAADPTGAVFGLWQPKNHKGTEVRDEPGAMTWHELTTRDIARAKDFYSKFLGVTYDQVPAGGMDYFIAKKNDATVVGMMGFPPGMPSTVPPHWTNVFAVANTDAAVKYAMDHGGQTLFPATESSFGRFATITDPAGAAFSVITLPTK